MGEKKFDFIDIALVGGFVMATGTACYMWATGQTVPSELLATVGGIFAYLTGKKTPNIIGK